MSNHVNLHSIIFQKWGHICTFADTDILQSCIHHSEPGPKPILRSPIGGNFFLALLYILIHILTKCRPYTILFGVWPYFQYNVWTSTWYILNICYFLDLIQVPRSSDYCLLFVCRIRTVSKANVWNIECLIFKHPNKIYQKDKY